MNFYTSNVIRAIAICVSLLNLVASPLHAGQPALEKLEAPRLSPDSGGTLIYRGTTYTQKTPKGEPLFRYERRIHPVTNGISASHITSDPTGQVIITETSVMSPNYELQQFEVQNQQSGFSGTVKFSNGGRHIEYELNEGGKISKASEDVSETVVSGPSMFGFILSNWEVLKSGTTIPVRMLVLNEKTTYGFDIKFEKLVNGQASFTLTPSSFLIRMAIKPFKVVFDANTKTPISYEGRVPPMENVLGKLRSLDARVEYTSVSTSYR
ncbi:hypothetical protein MCEMSHM24_03094 [Comamonadaceae bacterium]|jgi:hypothetical protein